MSPSPGAPRTPDLAQVRHDNALALFDEFVHQCARNPDPATLRGLERRFAEQLLIQPSYWSQIKGRSRQIGERLARQFEQRCKKPNGWMDLPRSAGQPSQAADVTAPSPAAPAPEGPQNDDERFILGLVLTYYRRHPQRARTRLLDLLGEVLMPQAASAAPATALRSSPATGRAAKLPEPPAPPAPAPEVQLWQRAQTGVAPLKRKK